MKLFIKSLLAVAVGAAFLSGPIAQADDVAEVTITADKLTFFYDIKEFKVKAGQKVKLTFINPKDSMNLQPHNLIIIKPGKLQAMIAGVSDPGRMSDPKWLKNPIPAEGDDLHAHILHHTKLLAYGEEETLEFTAPSEPGDYPYVCSFPGHAALMNGVMKVEK